MCLHALSRKGEYGHDTHDSARFSKKRNASCIFERRNIMSLSSIASNSVYQPNQVNPFSQIKKNFQDVNSALQSSSMSTAYSAFATLQADSAPTTSSGNPLSQDIQSLGSAIQSGSLFDAQQAMSTIQE